MRRPLRHPILVIDDDVRTARLLVRLLGEDGFDASSTTKQAALGEGQDELTPDAILIDSRVPSNDELEILHRIRGRCLETPIFVLTNYPERVAAFASEFAPYAVVVPKPLDYEALSRMLHQRLSEPPKGKHKRSREAA